MLSIIVVASSCAQTANNSNTQENVSEREMVVNNKKVKEKVVTVSLKGVAIDQPRDYTFSSSPQAHISVALETENPQINFAIYYKGENISGKKLIRYWKTDNGMNGQLTVRVYFENSKTNNIVYVLRIAKSQ